MRASIATMREWILARRESIAAISNVVKWCGFVLEVLTLIWYGSTHEQFMKGDYALHYWWVLAIIIVAAVLHEQTRDKSPYDTDRGFLWWRW